MGEELYFIDFILQWEGWRLESTKKWIEDNEDGSYQGEEGKGEDGEGNGENEEGEGDDGPGAGEDGGGEGGEGGWVWED